MPLERVRPEQAAQRYQEPFPQVSGVSAGPNARPGADCLQRPLLRRSHFRQQVSPALDGQ